MDFLWIRVLAFSVLSAAASLHLAQAEPVPADAKPQEHKSPGLLLANVWTPAIDPTGWWVSEKYDGLRGYWDGALLWTREGNAIHAPDFFLAELPRGVPLDGELWIGRGKFEETVGTVRARVPGEDWRRVRYMVFDAPGMNGSFEERQAFLHATFPKEHHFVHIVKQERCTGAAELLAERDRIVAAGGEGLMLRQPDSRYAAGRSPTLLKVKPLDDAEATVTAHLAGKGRFAGKLGALRVRTADGREFSVGTGFSAAQRADPPPVGALITYTYRGLTAKGLPRFPAFLRVRTDGGGGGAAKK